MGVWNYPQLRVKVFHRAQWCIISSLVSSQGSAEVRTVAFRSIGCRRGELDQFTHDKRKCVSGTYGFPLTTARRRTSLLFSLQLASGKFLCLLRLGYWTRGARYRYGSISIRPLCAEGVSNARQLEGGIRGWRVWRAVQSWPIFFSLLFKLRTKVWGKQHGNIATPVGFLLKSVEMQP